MISQHSSPTPSETFSIGGKIGDRLKGDEILLLSGELGAGKTLLAKGIASSLGIDPREIVSPTFTLLNHFEFQTPAKKKGKVFSGQLIHFDCYRLGLDIKDGSAGLMLPEIDEWIDEAIIMIEWAQYLHRSYFTLPNTIKIRLEICSSRERLIEIETPLKDFELPPDSIQ